MNNKKVLLGMSGGVDSSSSAVLLMQKGYEVIGCTLLLWDDEKDTNKAAIDAKRVCDELNIAHHVIDFRKEFKCEVINYFINEYEDGRTPNPCVQCNKYIKFEFLYEKAKELGCEYFATGHYAKVEFSKRYNQNVMRKSNEVKKDQTYFLYTITKEQIDHLIFPLQDYKSKDEIRNIASQSNLDVAVKKDSQEICFIPDNDYQAFLKNNSDKKCKTGNIILNTGEIVGKHNGLTNYTIGQRKGLGISYKYPLYVTRIDKEKNQVIVGKEEELFKKELYASKVNWVIENIFSERLECYAKIRYRSKESKAIVIKEDGKIKVQFEENQRAITPGQSVVFYDEDGILLGGGTIM